jgi:acetylornithine/succinyldiaminopimelate/putrescine aminotransferase
VATPPRDAFRAFTRHVNPALGRFLEVAGRDTRFVRASGCQLEDDQGRRWDDFVAGFGALCLGHDPQPIRAAIEAHLARGAPSMLVEALSPHAGALAARLVARAGPRFETAFLCNSGAEAIEAALKTAMLATGRPKIAYAEGGYHGTTLGALACMARGAYRDPFAALVDRLGFVEVPFGDLDALERALSAGDVAAFLVEPVQMEAGVRIASSDYLSGAAALCRTHGTLFVLDEVQTGLGRTGRLFAFEHALPQTRPASGGSAIDLRARPDVLVLAKALGAGVVPVGAAVMGEGIWRKAYGSYLSSEIHNTTLGGNALACAVAHAVLDAVDDDAFLARVRARGEAIEAALRARLEGCSIVERISMLGLLGGVKLAPHASTGWMSWESLGLPELAGHPSAGALVVERLYRKRILAQPCGHDWSVVRIEPPLVVDEATCARFVDGLASAIRWLEEQGGG